MVLRLNQQRSSLDRSFSSQNSQSSGSQANVGKYQKLFERFDTDQTNLQNDRFDSISSFGRSRSSSREEGDRFEPSSSRTSRGTRGREENFRESRFNESSRDLGSSNDLGALLQGLLTQLTELLSAFSGLSGSSGTSGSSLKNCDRPMTSNAGSTQTSQSSQPTFTLSSPSSSQSVAGQPTFTLSGGDTTIQSTAQNAAPVVSSLDPTDFESLLFDISISENASGVVLSNKRDQNGVLLGDFNRDGVADGLDSFRVRETVNGGDSDLTSADKERIREDLRNVVRFNIGKSAEDAFRTSGGMTGTLIGDLDRNSVVDGNDLAVLNQSMAEPLDQQSAITKQIFG